MSNSRVRDIKKAQKEKLLYKKLSQLFLQMTLDDTRVRDTFISRVKLSDDKSICTIYFYTPHGEDYFNNVLEVLKLYKPSLRKALASTIESRYTPELRFSFDEQHEKQEKLEQLLDRIKEEV